MNKDLNISSRWLYYMLLVFVDNLRNSYTPPRRLDCELNVSASCLLIFVSAKCTLVWFLSPKLVVLVVWNSDYKDNTHSCLARRKGVEGAPGHNLPVPAERGRRRGKRYCSVAPYIP